jgi:hypothetical protein
MPTVFDHVVDVLMTGPLLDIDVPGAVVPEDGHRRFRHHYRAVYFRLRGGAIVRVLAHESEGTLQLSVVDQVSFDFRLPEGAEYGVTSIAELRLTHPESQRRITSLTLLCAEPDAAREGRARCAVFGIEGNGVLFLDPVALSGMQIAGREAYREWLREFGRRPEARYQAVWQSGMPAEIQPSNIDALLERSARG